MNRELTQFDVVILGGGLAGLSLARHLLLETEKTVLLLERRDQLPPERQKVGESSVQVAGYYFSRVLDLEEYLLHEHFMKYNLRFYWKSGGRDNSGFEEYSASYIRKFSNIASYQLDRNTFEGELLRRNREDSRFHLSAGLKTLEVELAPEDSEEPHVVSWSAEGDEHRVEARWVVDTTGRRKLLARKLELPRRNPIRHGAFYWWVEGLVDIERLSERPLSEWRKCPSRRQTGHLPSWLATNHFCDEGLWFWVIPLRGKTSLGLVFDHRVVDPREVFTVEKATKWVSERFPLFAADLAERRVLDFGGHKDFSHDCALTLSPHRWALSGEAGRFTDPLYSPGSDLISLHNTLIVDAIATDDTEERQRKCRTYEPFLRSMYQAYVPSYHLSYDTLGDQETFSLKYVWELAIYFGFYVFPFINDLFTDRRFLLTFMRLFGRLGPTNQGIQRLLSGYFQWKKDHLEPSAEPVYFDFTEMGTLAAAEKTFYQVGIPVDEAKKILTGQLENLEELARFLAAHVAAVVLDAPQLLTNRRYVESIDLADLHFDPKAMAKRWRACEASEGFHEWSFDPFVLERFRTPRRSPARPVPVLEEVAG